jgi:hypothetical protein
MDLSLMKDRRKAEDSLLFDEPCLACLFDVESDDEVSIF